MTLRYDFTDLKEKIKKFKENNPNFKWNIPKWRAPTPRFQIPTLKPIVFNRNIYNNPAGF